MASLVQIGPRENIGRSILTIFVFITDSDRVSRTLWGCVNLCCRQKGWGKYFLPFSLALCPFMLTSLPEQLLCGQTVTSCNLHPPWRKEKDGVKSRGDAGSVWAAVRTNDDLQARAPVCWPRLTLEGWVCFRNFRRGVKVFCWNNFGDSCRLWLFLKVFRVHHWAFQHTKPLDLTE